MTASPTVAPDDDARPVINTPSPNAVIVRFPADTNPHLRICVQEDFTGNYVCEPFSDLKHFLLTTRLAALR